MTELADFKLDLGTMAQVMNEVCDTVFFVKSQDKRYIAGNAALAQVCGVRNPPDVIGRSTREFFPDHIVARYDALDDEVMGRGVPLHNRLDFTVEACGKESWFLYSRLPLQGTNEGTRAALGLSRRLPASKHQYKVYERLYYVSETIVEHFAARLDLTDLADMAGTSKSQLERDFAKIFGMTPHQYQTRLRMEHAKRLLTGSLPLAEVGQDCGYADQSAFTRRFSAYFGKSPAAVRRETRAGGGVLA